MNCREETPWNYCDYRCEVCEYQSTCAVYHTVETERRICMLEGKDPDGIENAIQSVASTLSTTLLELRARAREMGLDPDHLPEGDLRENSFEEDPLCQKAYVLSLRTLKFVQERPVFPAEDRIFTEAWDDLLWHCTVFSAKIARAGGGQTHPEEYAASRPSDREISFDIALKSIQHCTNALSILRGTLPIGNNELDAIQAAFAEVREAVLERLHPKM